MPEPPCRNPIALPRRSGGKAALTSVIASAVTNAAPAPCTARPSTRTTTSGAAAHAADAAVKRAIPAANMRRRPYRSPSAAAGMSSTAITRL
jgi:hypothetical protein